jgi:hypothetical protein
MARARADTEPKSWGELLQRREAERNQPPPPEAYAPPQVRHYPCAGIFSDSTFLSCEKLIACDTHLYATTALFDPEEAPEQPRRVLPSHDHGLDILSWPKPLPGRPLERARVAARDRQVRDFDAITGVPIGHFFKARVQELLDRRERATAISMRRTIDPVSQTFPTASLEETRAYEAALEREAFVARRLARLPPNEQRARSRALNPVTGECTDEAVAAAAVNDFPRSRPERSAKAIAEEEQILAARERTRGRDLARVSCRYNGHRARLELRDWNPINGAPVKAVLSDDVKYLPGVWDWCVAESLPS